MRLAADSERPNLPWSFKVVDDPIVNAFALPGGFIYVTRGILAHFNTEAELAGVLGHEIGHVTARHGAAQMSRQQAQQIGLGLGMVASERFREYGGLAAGALQMLNLSYSRGQESQSDELGLRYIAREGYDADAMVGVFQMLASAGGGGDGARLPEWQLSHPYPENREANIRAAIDETGASRNGIVNRDEYLRMIDGIVYGANPREGYFDGSLFLHPDLAFELSFPSGWQTVNQRSVVAGISPSEDAVVMLALVPEGAAPDAELRDFLRGEGMTGGPITERTNGGIQFAQATFQATSAEETISGEVAFARYNDLTYRILGYSSPAGFDRYGREVGATLSSFGAVTDRRVLDVQPMRLTTTTLSQAMSLNSFVQSFPQPVDIEELARLNRVLPSEVISAGTRIKTISGTPIG
jgi:predicted Zn-dependent protease